MTEHIYPRCPNCDSRATDSSWQTAPDQFTCNNCSVTSWTDEDVGHQVNLIRDARNARDHAYAPYSEFKVGAAIRCESGGIYTGCNVEVSGRNTSIHAEAMAVFNAVVAGESEFEELAVSCSDEGGHFPCALCMHTLSEFMTDITIITDEGDTYTEYSLDEEYGEAYRPGDHS